MAGIAIRAVDVSQHKRAEAELIAGEAKYRALVEHVPAVIYTQSIDSTASTLYQSPQIEALLGYSAEEWMADPTLWARLLHPDDRDRVLTEATATNENGKPFNMEYRLIARDGRSVWIRDASVLVHDDEGQPLYWQGVLLDITDRKAIEEQLAYQAFHDPLTGLPNRALFMNRLEHALEVAARRHDSVGVLFLDLDRFKVINDSLGHEVGDQMLIAVARRLSTCLRGGDTVARFGGDEFTVLLESVSGAEEASEIADRLIESMRAPFALPGRQAFIETSIGIAVSSPPQPRPADLIREADAALYRAKAGGRARATLFEPAMAVQAVARLELETSLRQAIQAGELRVHYQPLVDLGSGRVTEVEALVRWEHPTHGLLSPATFVPLAEETGLIVPIGEWVLFEACRQARAWHDAFPDEEPIVMGVNLSVRHLQQPNVAEWVAGVLAETGLEPSCLKLEITESAALVDSATTLQILTSLKRLGVRLAVDDFGTGYSGLSSLKTVPVDTLKIDRSFIGGLGRDQDDTAIVRATIDFARSLGLTVTAEGIETTDQLAHLLALGCDRGQGYLFARPLGSDEIADLLSRGATWSDESPPEPLAVALPAAQSLVA
jgi:diguanylate cyclase (GGDEF)-like protein/PAS domain S-box-containing protein